RVAASLEVHDQQPDPLVHPPPSLDPALCRPPEVTETYRAPRAGGAHLRPRGARCGDPGHPWNPFLLPTRARRRTTPSRRRYGGRLPENHPGGPLPTGAARPSRCPCTPGRGTPLPPAPPSRSP